LNRGYSATVPKHQTGVIQPPYKRGSVHPGEGLTRHRHRCHQVQLHTRSSSGLFSHRKSTGYFEGIFRLSFPPILGHSPTATTRAPGARGQLNTLACLASRPWFCAKGCEDELRVQVSSSVDWDSTGHRWRLGDGRRSRRSSSSRFWSG
ncbi:unnamed protein product, partial [Scytosiphon promiscuus]